MISDLSINNKKIPISVIILTQNEEINIGACLNSVLPYFDDIWVIDSYSNDTTIAIAQSYTVKILQNKFIDYALQRNWALQNADLKYEWTIFIDADEQVTHKFCFELQEIVSKVAPEVGGMSLGVYFYFLGRHLRFARPSLPMLRVLRRGRVVWQGQGPREHGIVKGEIITLVEKILHDDKKSLAEWSQKHIKNAILESEAALQSSETALSHRNDRTTQERRIRFWLRAKIWNRLPRLWRAFPYFIYRYIIKGGFFDGKAGLAYCFLQALWYPLLIDLMVIDKLNRKQTQDR